MTVPEIKRSVALLRGVNVGVARKIAMADLRRVVEGLGFGDVRTVLNSGNVVLTSAETDPACVAHGIEQALAERLGILTRVIVLSAADFAAIARGNRLLGLADNPSRLLVAFVATPGDVTRLEPLSRQDWSPEALALGPGAAYLWCPDGVVASPLAQAVARELGNAVTTRSWSTVLRIDALLG